MATTEGADGTSGEPVSAEAGVEVEDTEFLYGAQQNGTAASSSLPTPTALPVPRAPDAAPAVLPGGTQRPPAQKRRADVDEAEDNKDHVYRRVDAVARQYHCSKCNAPFGSRSQLLRHAKRERESHECEAVGEAIHNKQSWADMSMELEGPQGPLEQTQSQRVVSLSKPEGSEGKAVG